MFTQKELDNYTAPAYRKGVEEGIKQGLEQGLEQGLKQGAHQEKISIAKALLKQGVVTAIILQSTGLTQEELASL